LKTLEAYPEGPVKLHKGRTPCHAAALVGDDKKLILLKSDIDQRYTNNRSVDKENAD
jgi:hypothetical protein